MIPALKVKRRLQTVTASSLFPKRFSLSFNFLLFFYELWHWTSHSLFLQFFLIIMLVFAAEVAALVFSFIFQRAVSHAQIFWTVLTFKPIFYRIICYYTLCVPVIEVPAFILCPCVCADKWKPGRPYEWGLLKVWWRGGWDQSCRLSADSGVCCIPLCINSCFLSSTFTHLNILCFVCTLFHWHGCISSSYSFSLLFSPIWNRMFRMYSFVSVSSQLSVW